MLEYLNWCTTNQQIGDYLSSKRTRTNFIARTIEEDYIICEINTTIREFSNINIIDIVTLDYNDYMHIICLRAISR